MTGLQQLMSQACGALYLRASVGWTTDIWVITGLRRPAVTGGLYYHDDDYLPSEIRTTIKPILFTPHAGTQRASNEWKYLYSTGIPQLTADDQVLVFSRAGRLIHPHEPELSDHLRRLRDALTSNPKILGSDRHRLLAEPLSELILAHMTALAIH